MNLPAAKSKTGRIAGILLVQCVTYLAVLTILGAVATGAFYLCWDHSKALVYATDDIRSALNAGELWRADVRNATGKISVETSVSGEVVQIPVAGKKIIYRFESGEVRRETEGSQPLYVLLPKVNSSHVSAEARNGVTAWRWELDLVVRRPETHLPLLFTFEAAQTKP
jgi:hypothetical protein